MTVSEALSLHNIGKDYGSHAALTEVSLQGVAGESLALLGPSGSGKTTLLRLIAGLETPDHGEIRLRGRRASTVRRTLIPPHRRRIGMLFQDLALWPHMTVKAHVAFAVSSRKQRAERVTEILAQVRLSVPSGRYPHQLSGGEQQRLALARALASDPQLLLLDEPFSGLDPGLADELQSDLAALHQRLGFTLIVVTHDNREALRLAQRIGVLCDGRLAQIAAPATLYHAPANPCVARLLGEAMIIRGEWQGPRCVTTPLGALPVQGAGEGAVRVMLRPHHLILTPNGPYAACVTRRTVAGERFRYELHSAAGKLIAYSSKNLTPDTRVTFELTAPAYTFG